MPNGKYNKLSEQNNKLLDTVSDLVPKIGNNNTITNNNITNNNNFNIQIFLNEDCKDAISMIDFVKSLVPTLYLILNIFPSFIFKKEGRLRL